MPHGKPHAGGPPSVGYIQLGATASRRILWLPDPPCPKRRERCSSTEFLGTFVNIGGEQNENLKIVSGAVGHRGFGRDRTRSRTGGRQRGGLQPPDHRHHLTPRQRWRAQPNGSAPWHRRVHGLAGA